MEPTQQQIIGSGPLFPIRLATEYDEDGNPIMVPQITIDENGNPQPVMDPVYDDEGNPVWVVPPDPDADPPIEGIQKTTPHLVPKVSWRPTFGSPELIKASLTSLMSYVVGFRFRQEAYGNRLWETLEDPNTPVLRTQIRDYIRDAIAKWEPRIKAISTQVESSGSSITITLKYMLADKSADELVFNYDIINSTVSING